jgi:hypothetical protein
MLTAMTAVENMVQEVTTKDNIWSINNEMEYHKRKKSPRRSVVTPAGCCKGKDSDEALG